MSNLFHYYGNEFKPGGGGTQIWFRRRCAAEAAKPVPIFKGHFGKKGYPLGVFIQENDAFVYFSDEWAKISKVSTVKLQNYTPCLGIFRQNNTPCLGIFFCEKVTHFSGTPPYTLLGEYPPPPPPGIQTSIIPFVKIKLVLRKGQVKKF